MANQKMYTCVHCGKTWWVDLDDLVKVRLGMLHFNDLAIYNAK